MNQTFNIIATIKKCTQMIKQAFVSKVSDDSSAYPQVQVTHNGKTGDAIRFSPYGLFSNAPDGSFVLLLNINGQESVKFAIPASTINRYKNAKKGECGLYNELTKSFVLMHEDGSIHVDSKKDLNIDVVGNVNANIGGNLDAKIEGTATVESVGVMTLKAPTIKLEGAIQLLGSVIGNATGNSINAPDGLKTGSLDWETHYHAQGNDDDGDVEQDTGQPQS